MEVKFKDKDEAVGMLLSTGGKRSMANLVQFLYFAVFKIIVVLYRKDLISDTDMYDFIKNAQVK